MISGNVPTHLLVAARTGFLETSSNPDPAYAPIAEVINMTAKSIDLVDLGSAPMPSRNRGKPTLRDFIERKMTVTPLDWDITVGISHNAVRDDQTGTLDRKVRNAGANFQRHIAQQAFKALNDGDGTNFGLCYDGLSFFNDSHVDKGAEYATVQDNKYALPLSIDNFETVRVAASVFRDDQGEFINYNFNTLIVPPALERIGRNIVGNPQAYDTANREINPYAGVTNLIVHPNLDSTAWILTAGGQPTKPIIIAIREQPNLQSAWFDPLADDGGMYYFKFYARYNHFYGDWRTAIMGNT
jgi:phage major head subunit gpT-like protein